jgi:hypothetical protein
MLTKKKNIGSTLKGVRGKMKKLGITEKDVGKAVQWTKSRKKWAW